MYTIINGQNGNGGIVKSSFTGEEIAFQFTPDGSDKRRSIFLIEEINKKAVERVAEKLGKQPTTRQMLALGRGEQLPAVDNRPMRQQIAESGTVEAGAPFTGNPYLARIEELKNLPDYEPGSKAKIAERIKRAEAASQTWEAKQAAEQKIADRKFEISTDISAARIDRTLVTNSPAYNQVEMNTQLELTAKLENLAIEPADYKIGKAEMELAARIRRQEISDVMVGAARSVIERAKMIKKGDIAAPLPDLDAKVLFA
jgi:hypothetical protein